VLRHRTGPPGLRKLCRKRRSLTATIISFQSGLKIVSRYSSIAEAASALRAGETSAVALLEEVSAIADRLDGRLAVFERRDSETALAAAKRADNELRAGNDRGLLHGIPVGVKLTISRDAHVFRRIEEAGAVVLGATSSVECADPFGKQLLPRNPWDLTRTPGGSSAGSSSGVAAGFFLGALGGDTGGSNRIPAAFTNVSALKPTHGIVGRSGVVPLSPTCDAIGPIARSADDLRALLAAIAGEDPDDPATHGAPSLKTFVPTGRRLDGVRIGVDYLDRYAAPRQVPSVRARLAEAAAILGQTGATIVDVEIPLFRELCIARIVTFAAESAVLNRKILQRNPAALERTTRELASVGYAYTAADYVQAQRVRHAGQRALAALFEQVDVIFTPTTAAPAPRIPEAPDPDLTRTDPAGLNAYCGIWNLAGNPAVSIPAGFASNGLPVSIQVVGRPFEDLFVLHVGDVFQSISDVHRQRPPREPASVDDEPVRAGSPEPAGDPLEPALSRALADLPRLYGVNLEEAEIETLRRVLPVRRATIAGFDAIPEERFKLLTPVSRIAF
jgi:aspartyl-tRNA(Asn)/glutamyl-tRNA(Gln) amidotransferase subunit A